jgi:hypothetical protein
MNSSSAAVIFKVSAICPPDSVRERAVHSPTPVYARVTTVKPDLAALLDLPTHRLKHGQRIGIAERVLESMPGHDDQVRALPRPVGPCRGLDPLDPFRIWFASGYREHRGCAIDTRDAMTTSSQAATESASTATQIEGTTGLHSGEGEIELSVLCPGVRHFVKLCNLGILVVHAVPRGAAGGDCALALKPHPRRSGVTRSGAGKKRAAPPSRLVAAPSWFQIILANACTVLFYGFAKPIGDVRHSRCTMHSGPCRTLHCVPCFSGA